MAARTFKMEVSSKADQSIAVETGSFSGTHPIEVTINDDLVDANDLYLALRHLADEVQAKQKTLMP